MLTIASSCMAIAALLMLEDTNSSDRHRLNWVMYTGKGGKGLVCEVDA